MDKTSKESSENEVRLPNPHLDQIKSDYTYHLGIPLDQDTAKKFADVKFVCIGGTPGRMRSTCTLLARQLYGHDIKRNEDFDFYFENERYSGYKKGDIFCVNHGMGLPSLSIMMHEVLKLLRCARCRDVTILRLGTCGGVGVPPGTVIISEESLDMDLAPLYHTSSFGEHLNLPVKSDISVINDLKSVWKENECLQDIPLISAKTYCIDDFYQGQARLDGSFCDKTEADRQRFYTKLYEHGVRNIEMESAGVLALTYKAGVKAAVVCVAVDSLEIDINTVSPEQMNQWIERPIRLAAQLIKSKLFP